VTANYSNQTQALKQTSVLSCSFTAKNILTGIFGISLFVGLTYVGSLIRIPLQPVPITLQTLFVLLAGAVLGGRRGSFAELSYVTIGVFGVPIFAGHTAGLAVLAGPTGGYIAAFILAPILIGRLIHRSRSLYWQASVFSFGTLLILAMGTLHLTVFYTHSIAQSLMVGVVPFIPGALFKIAAATSIYRAYSALRNHYGRR
jgi:biotin transport system substrate-specific component